MTVPMPSGTAGVLAIEQTLTSGLLRREAGGWLVISNGAIVHQLWRHTRIPTARTPTISRRCASGSATGVARTGTASTTAADPMGTGTGIDCDGLEAAGASRARRCDGLVRSRQARPV
jgi:hypothetical protein